MTDFSVTNYNPYNMYQSYGYYYPMFRGTATSTASTTGQYNDVPQLQQQSDTVSFSANDQIQAETKKQGLSTGAKIAIGTGIIAGALIGADFIFCKGKHIKSLFKQGKKPGSPKPPATEKPTETVEQKVKEAVNTSMINPLDRSKAIKIDEYESLSKAVEDCKVKMNSGDYGVPKGMEDMLNSLTGHSYGNDKSYIQVVTRSLKHDYVGRVLDIEKNEFYKTRMLINQGHSGFRLPDYVGEYLITTLPTGQKVVSVSLPTGRFDPRRIRMMMSVISKGEEFTPLQKDLIEIISNRKEVLKNSVNNTDIMTIGVLANDKAGYRVSENPIEINKEVLLSSISKAKESLTESSIDKEFVEKALNVKGNERVAKFGL